MSYYIPSPSSRSSSPANDLDSSPPSSPSQTLYDVHPAESTSFNHPFAGSTHAGRKFREYEKKPVFATAFDASSHGMTRYRSLEESREPNLPAETLPGDEDDFDDDVGNTSIDTAVPSDIAPVESFIMKPQVAMAKWEEVITDIVLNPSQLNEIDLTGTFIGYISRSIIDLNNVVVLPQTPPTAVAIASAARKFARAATSPLEFTGSRLERNIGRTGSLDRWKSTSFSTSMTGLQLKLKLVRCGIRTLPLELFHLEFLTSLDLRGNLLTLLPAQINQLRNLRELNISTNRLRYLPSEILDMNLINLQVHPNDHFIPKPPSSASHLRPITRVAVSGIRLRSSAVPSLQEHCFRVLLQNYSEGGESTNTPNLKVFYELPLPPQWRLSEAALDILKACYPGAVPKSAAHKKARLDPQALIKDEAQEIPAGLGICPRAMHSHSGLSIFVDHVEERFTWETRIAGKDLFGMAVPILWRGCSKGCLRFLDDEEEEEIEIEGDEMSEGDNEDGVNVVSFDAGQSLAFSDDEGMEL